MSNLYLYNFLYLTFFLVLCEAKLVKKKYYKNIVILYFLIIFGQRWSAGVDFFGYLRYYLISFPTEIGYRTIEKFFREHNLYFGLLIFLIYLFTTLTSIWFFRKFVTSNYTLYFFFLSEYHIMSINPLRTYIAINFFLIALYYLYFYNKKIISIFWIIIGSLFHKSIVFIIPFYFIYKKRIRKEYYLFLYILPLIPSYQIIKLVLILFPKYSIYLGSVYDTSLSILNILRYYVVLTFYLYLYPDNLGDKNFNFINKLMWIFMFLIGLSTSFAPLHRVAYFFKIFEVLSFSYLFIKTTKKYKKYLIIVFFIINYFFIAYKDMGLLKNYRYRKIQLRNPISIEEYYEELKNYSENKDKKGI